MRSIWMSPALPLMSQVCSRPVRPRVVVGVAIREASVAEFVAAIDQGTTQHAVHIIAVRPRRRRGRAPPALKHEQIMPKAGWVEHNPVEIRERTASVLASALNKTELPTTDLAPGGSRHHQPARTARMSTSRFGRSQRDILAGHPDGPIAHPPSTATAAATSSGERPDCRLPRTSLRARC